ncbi:MAG: Ig-like domain-containing protein, partial [Cytophaga sp.]|uniref:Ig-like domain-containing protein n=1 Tax=Cytophaga sp. TaxID=29535 RepID=UPI003F7D89D9
QTYTATTAGNYTVEVTNANNCKAISSATTVTVNALPTAAITANGSTAIPQGGSVELQANAGTGFTYKWFKGSTQVGTGASYIATAAGAYTVEVTNGDDCSSTSPATTVSVNANQPSVITITSPAANATITGAVDIAVNVTDPDGSITLVEFLDGNTVIGTSTTAPYVYTWNNPSAGPHTITVRVTDSNGGITVSAPTEITSSTPTGVQLPNTLNASIYPNPSNSIMYIDSDADLSNASFILIDVLGRETVVSPVLTGSGAKIDVTGLSDGSYVFIINNNISILRKKVAIIR